MKDMTKASNPFYLAFFLLVVCGVSTLVMAVTAVKTDAPIKLAQAKETADSQKPPLPGRRSKIPPHVFWVQNHPFKVH